MTIPPFEFEDGFSHAEKIKITAKIVIILKENTSIEARNSSEYERKLSIL